MLELWPYAFWGDSRLESMLRSSLVSSIKLWVLVGKLALDCLSLLLLEAAVLSVAAETFF